MRRELTLHPDSRRTAATRIDADASRQRSGALVLRWVVGGLIRDLVLPPEAAPKRAVGLWQHTCFEAFVRAPPDEHYYEFNLAPSTQWAAFRFEGYRKAMRVAGAIEAPRIEVRSDSASLTLQATLELGGLPDLPADTAWRVGLAAVLEEAHGGLTHWALAHPPGRPDFHHSDCFALELRPA